MASRVNSLPPEPPSPYAGSSYSRVKCLLLQWEDDNLGVDSEMSKIDAVLSRSEPDGYNFATERWLIPSQCEPPYGSLEAQVSQRLYKFCEGASPQDLLILYYSGHGGGEPEHCIWTATDEPGSAELNWHSVHTVILNCRAHVLLILDCCYAALAKSPFGVSENWMLVASSEEGQAMGVDFDSFSTALYTELERRAHMFWRHGTRISAQDLHTDLVVWHRDLRITPIMVKLTKIDCKATDLTPIPSSFKPLQLKSFKTEPVNVFTTSEPTANLPARTKLPTSHRRDPTRAPSVPITSSLITSLTSSSLPALTSVHDCTRSGTEANNIDIVLVHGDRGVANFASYMSTIIHELEQISILSRILVYTWKLSEDSRRGKDTENMHDDLDQRLANMRSKHPQRPLFFIGYGLGGILVKKYVTSSLDNILLERLDLDTPILACSFVGLPQLHRLSNEVADEYFNELSHVHQSPTRPNSQHKAIKPKAVEISATFAATIETWDIFITHLGCSRRESTEHNQLAYSHLSQEYDMDVVALTNEADETVFRNTFMENAKKALGLNEAPAELSHVRKERVLPKLKKYDTVFLVDDSGSMAGRRWARTKNLLAKIAHIAMQYDDDGVDIKFFNTGLKKGEGRNLISEQSVEALFKGVEPDGGTDTADMIVEELGQFCRRYISDNDIKGLNLIILTDGAPSKGQDVEAAIVKYAQKLEQIGAPPLKVGLQFVQIGVDEQAAAFLAALDDGLKEKYSLDRDMVDTVPWVQGDHEHLYEKILLGGILKRLDEETGNT